MMANMAERTSADRTVRLPQTQHEPPLCEQQECHLLAALLNETPQGVLVVAADGIIAHVNLAMSVLFLPARVMQGGRLDTLSGLEQVAALVQEAATSRGRVTGELRLPSDTDQPSAQVRFFHATAAPWSESGGHGVWVMLEETTQRLLAGQRHLDFIRQAGHDLRAPLSLIHGYLETLRSGMIKSGAALQRCVEVMDKHSRQMMRLIEDMLLLARLENEPPPSSRNTFLARGCVDDALEHLFEPLRRLKAQVEVDFPADGGLLHGDRQYWDQIFTKLIEDALQRTRQPGLRLKISGQWSARECIITLTDDAQPSSLVAKDIDAAPARSVGLAWSIVQRAVAAHGGSIEVASNAAAGSVFTIRLPLPG